MTNNLMVKEVNFDGDVLKAIQNNDGSIFVGAKWVCNGIGLTRGQSNGEITKIQTDEVLKMGCMKFRAGVFDANNTTIAIMIDFLPLWLAKISITPNMKKNNPELVEKLIAYQLKAKDVLAQAFLPQQPQTQNLPLQALKGIITQIEDMDRKQNNIQSLYDAQSSIINNHNSRLLTVERQITELQHDIPQHPVLTKKQKVIKQVLEIMCKRYEDISDVKLSKIYKECLMEWAEYINDLTILDIQSLAKIPITIKGGFNINDTMTQLKSEMCKNFASYYYTGKTYYNYVA